jgi:hypothetical protein
VIVGFSIKGVQLCRTMDPLCFCERKRFCLQSGLWKMGDDGIGLINFFVILFSYFVRSFVLQPRFVRSRTEGFPDSLDGSLAFKTPSRNDSFPMRILNEMEPLYNSQRLLEMTYRCLGLFINTGRVDSFDRNFHPRIDGFRSRSGDSGHGGLDGQ